MPRNVPGVSLYFLSLSRLRSLVGRSSLFRAKSSSATAATDKVKLTPAGDLLVGSTARTAVGFVLTPFTLLKTISEVSPTLPAISWTTRHDLTDDLSRQSTISIAQSGAAAAASGGASPSATVSASRPPSTFTALQTLYASGGLRSLWRGAVPTALRDAPGAGLFIVFYERGQRLLGKRGDGGKGAVGGGLAGERRLLGDALFGFV